jgi:hypothetical protein
MERRAGDAQYQAPVSALTEPTAVTSPLPSECSVRISRRITQLVVVLLGRVDRAAPLALGAGAGYHRGQDTSNSDGRRGTMAIKVHGRRPA